MPQPNIPKSSPLKSLSPKTFHYIKLVSFILAIILATGTLTFSILVYRDVLESQDQLVKLLKQQAALTKNYADRLNKSELARKEIEQELKTTQDLYAQTQSSLEQMNAQLEQTKVMLSQAQESNVQLKDYAKKVQRQAHEIREKIVGQFEQLKTQNTELKSEMDKLQDQIRYLSATDIKNKDEADSLLKLYKTNINLVKVKIKEFKNKAEKTQITIATEHDHLEAIVGNQGFLIKDGSVVKVNYKTADQSQIPAAISTKQKSRPKVDVTFVN